MIQNETEHSQRDSCEPSSCSWVPAFVLRASNVITAKTNRVVFMTFSTEFSPCFGLLVFPNRLACFLLRLFWTNSDVLELAIIHLHQLSPLPVALTGQSVGCSEAMQDLQKRNWRRSSIFGMQVGDLVQSFTGFQGMPAKRIGLFLSLHDILLVWLYLNTGGKPQAVLNRIPPR